MSEFVVFQSKECYYLNIRVSRAEKAGVKPIRQRKG